MKKTLQIATMLLGTLLVSKTASSQVTTQTLSFTGSAQSFTAPSCLQATITCYGAKGLNGASTASGAIGGNGGLGAMTQGVVSLTSGQTLNIYVGGIGTGTIGGYNGGGNGNNGASGAGGGASDIRLNGTALIDRIMVAGGGGGGGTAGCASATIAGGNGGAGGGGNGTAGVNSQAGGGGQGGNGSIGGAPGTGCFAAAGTVGFNGTSGIGGNGGAGVLVCGSRTAGGGGGGGYVGGGGGGGGTAGTMSCSLQDTGGGGGGAGGSNYFGTSITSTVSSNGVNNGDGYVIISYSLISTPTISVNSGSLCSGNSFTMAPTGATSYTFQGGSSVVSPTANTTYTVIGSTGGCVSNVVTSSVSVNVCAVAAALNFDGTDDRVNLGNGITTSLSGGTKVSVEAWVKPTSLSGLGCIVGNYSTGSANLQILLRRQGALNYEFWVGNGTSWYQTTSAVTPTLNVWQHVAATWNGTVASIYVNGVLSGTTTPAISTMGNAGSNPVWIGANTINENFTGDVDEIRIWNVVRTQCEINTYKNCEIPTTATGLLANYHFNQGIDAGTNTGITTLTDAAATNTGTLTNMALTTGTISNWVAPGGVTSGSVTPANLAITVGSTVTNSVICSGNSTTLSGTGANTYVWTNGVTNAVAFTPTVTNTYTVTGTNTLTGCTNTAVSSVTVNALPSVAANTTNALCNGGTGSATVTATGGTSPYTYLASNGATVSAQSNLMPGTYTYTVTDNNGCSKTQGLTITQPSAIVTTSAVTNILCNGGTGSATVTAIGGTSPYSYLASNGATVSTQSGLMAGSYTYTVTDANACTKTQALTITEPTAINLSSSASNASICAGASSTLTANATGGTGTITYTWVSGPTNNVNIVTPTTTAVYTVDVTDANNCAATSTVEITVNALPVVSVSSGAICAGESYTISATGALTYTSVPALASEVVTPTTTTSYTITGTDNNGCVSTNLSVSTVTVNSLPTISVNSGAICTGQSFTMVPTGAVTFTYSNGSSVATPTANATYSVNGTDANGCVSNVDAVSSVTVNALPTVLAVTNNTLLCTGETATLTVSGASTYTWSTTDNTTDVAVSPTVQTTYTVDGTDANGCVNSTTITQDVSLCTGVVTLSNSNSAINVYPNPNNGLFVIELTSGSKVTVTNALGQVVIAETFEAGKHNLDIHNEAKGVYFVKVIENNKQQIIKVIKE